MLIIILFGNQQVHSSFYDLHMTNTIPKVVYDLQDILGSYCDGISVSCLHVLEMDYGGNFHRSLDYQSLGDSYKDQFRENLDYDFYGLTDLDHLCEVLKDILVVEVANPSGENVIKFYQFKWLLLYFHVKVICLCFQTICSSNGIIEAHCALLAAQSPVFHSMFSHDLKEKEMSTVNISDMTIEVCQAFISYIYTSNIEHQDFIKHRLDLLRAAEKYDVLDIKDVSEKFNGNLLHSVS
ncbi:SKP1/BTB/POZ domain-containing protein [Artemisia annua]|uniref:SKP1/BTB/POZ domain-containing protein n=1 Tax=Artemisia annua TaxID=35608 RepID=A0A2U1MQF1_ARTAN|nr:SKP1/BTB/POZ domain-containing protein [Artemisia annua]